MEKGHSESKLDLDLVAHDANPNNKSASSHYGDGRSGWITDWSPQAGANSPSGYQSGDEELCPYREIERC